MPPFEERQSNWLKSKLAEKQILAELGATTRKQLLSISSERRQCQFLICAKSVSVDTVNFAPRNVTIHAVHPFAPMSDSQSRFGFVSFAETWNGRLAMMGFVIGLATELLTGQGILAQIGLG